ncbi:acyl carrier protein [Dactylosporangium sp. NPDC005555]|uniref:acyl carrier protein n=1 Tax=Dactylosporangium sp. NPDC005555 TaxID=3154889 RepID=UPI0033B535EE
MTGRAELIDLITDRLRTVLLMTPDEDLPPDRNYFELGLTSLQVIEVKEDLEASLGRRIDAAALYGRLTVADLADHLCEQPTATAPAVDPRKDLAAQLVRRLHSR